MLRGMPTVLDGTSDLIGEVFGLLGEEEIGGGIFVAWIVIAPTLMPHLDWLIGTGALFGLLFLLLGLDVICEVTAASIRRHI